MLGSWRIKSTDGGITWGAWEQIVIAGFTETENSKLGFEEAHFFFEGAVYAVVRVYDGMWTSVKAVFIKSEDNGATWTKISDLCTYADGMHEMVMEYLGDNHILVLARDITNSKSYHIESFDFGVTWGTLNMIQSAINIIGRNRMFTVAHLKGEASWWTDAKLIMTGYVHTDPPSSQGRRNAVWLSDNHATTWTGPIYLDIATEDGGYGDVIYDPDTDVYRVVTYKGNPNDADLVQYNFKVNWN